MFKAQMKKLTFYDVMDTLIKPLPLLSCKPGPIQETTLSFQLTALQVTQIATNRTIRYPLKMEYTVQVQLRFCLLDASCDQDDCFPPSVVVAVNNQICHLPKALSQTCQDVQPKGPSYPINITSNVKLSTTVINTVTVQWKPDSRDYCIAVYLVKKLTSAQLLQRLEIKGIKPADYTTALIKEKLREDADCEIATTMLKVSLNCPLGKMKMSIPCRASTCSHLQCFDANLYLQMNERKPTWNCPVCDKPAAFDDLVIDGYFQEVLASNLLKADDSEIQLHKDGSWSTHNLRNEAQKIEVLSDDIELLITKDVKPSECFTPSTGYNNLSTSAEDVVDLTLSDSDEELA